jgi:hypothetical protein
MSRPRKVLLLLCADFNRRSVLAYVLTVNGYHVIDNSTLIRDLVLCVDNDANQKPLELGFSAMTGVPTLMVNGQLNTRELLVLIKRTLVKKRGPKPAHAYEFGEMSA